MNNNDLETLKVESFFCSELSFAPLKETIPWRQNRIKIFGKEHLEPRLTAWCGPAYKYSSIQWPETPFNEILKPALEKLRTDLNFAFNSVLLNYYRNGQDSMGWHSDNEPELDDSCIASLSFGGERRMVFRHKNNHTNKQEILLKDGYLLVMRNYQNNWQHSIPKSKKMNEPRINLTFRRIIT